MDEDRFKQLYLQDFHVYGYYKTHKLQNNQTIGIYF